LRKIAVIDKNPDARFTQWRAISDPKKFFHNDNTLIEDIITYNPDLVFINKGNTFKNIFPAVTGRKTIYFYGDYYRPIPGYVQYYGSLCDFVILTNKDKQVWKSIDNKNIYFVSQGVDIDLFYPICTTKQYDIIFAANYLGPKFLGSDIRLEFARFIKNLPYKTAIIGNGWPLDIEALPRQGVIQLNRTINESRLTVGMSHFVDVPYYTSNRLYQCMATGVPHIAWASPRVKSLFRQGYIEVDSYEKLGLCIKKLLENHELRLDYGMKQFFEVRNHHTIFHFWEKVEAILEKFDGNRNQDTVG
jgi:hypothetical protein